MAQQNTPQLAPSPRSHGLERSSCGVPHSRMSPEIGPTSDQDGRMLHVRVVCPPDRRPRVLELLDAEPGVCNQAVFAGASQRPDGDLVQFDIATESANELIAALRQLGIHRDGSIAVERIDTALSDVARQAELRAPGRSSEAVVWEEVEARLRSDSEMSFSFLVLFVVAALIAAVGILTDSPILLVGAMVVGPEYAPVASLALGIHRRRVRHVRDGAKTLAVGFGLSIAACIAMTMCVRGLDRVPGAYAGGVRPLTQFISRPDLWSVVVALLAGIAGTVSLTEARAGALVGVLISVTTIPAAANIGVGVATAQWSEASGAAQQLLVNLVVLVVAGAVTLRVQWLAGRGRR